MLKLFIICIKFQLLRLATCCFPAAVVRPPLNDISSTTIKSNSSKINNLPEINLIAIQPVRFCLSDLKKNNNQNYYKNVFICYNNGNCHIKNVPVNLTHFQREPYCECQLVILFF